MEEQQGVKKEARERKREGKERGTERERGRRCLLLLQTHRLPPFLCFSLFSLSNRSSLSQLKETSVYVYMRAAAYVCPCQPVVFSQSGERESYMCQQAAFFSFFSAAVAHTHRVRDSYTYNGGGGRVKKEERELGKKMCICACVQLCDYNYFP